MRLRQTNGSDGGLSVGEGETRDGGHHAANPPGRASVAAVAALCERRSNLSG